MTASYKIALAAAASLLVVVIGVLIFRSEPTDPIAGLGEGVDGANVAAGGQDTPGEPPSRTEIDRGVTLSDEPVPAQADPADSVTIGRSPFGSERFDMESAELYPGEASPDPDAPLELTDAADSPPATGLDLTLPAEDEPAPIAMSDPLTTDTRATRPDDPIAALDTGSTDTEPTITVLPPPNPPKYTMHTIASGETFSSIAKKTYGDDKHWVDIAQANPLVDPKRLRVGQEIKLPDPETVGRSAAAAPAADLPDGVTMYTVKSGDSLSEIAVQFYGKAAQWKLIHEANRQLIGPEPTGLKVGMKLRIPPPTDGAR